MVSVVSEDEYKPAPKAAIKTGLVLNSLFFLSSANAAYAHGAMGFTAPPAPTHNTNAGATMPGAAGNSALNSGWGASNAHLMPNLQMASQYAGQNLTAVQSAARNTFTHTSTLAHGAAFAAHTASLASHLPLQTFETNAAGTKITGQGLSLDLSSTAANVVLGTSLFRGSPGGSATITMGGVSQVFSAGQKVTAAQYMAIKEALSGGQTLALAGNGSADGGSFNLNQAGAHTTLLVVPTGVTAIDNFSTSKTIAVAGDILNYGTIAGTTTNSHITSGTISGLDIVNEKGGLIDTVAGAASASSLSLTLNASNNFANAGTVATAGTLNLLAGSGSFSNSGTISSTSGNINLATPKNSLADINISAQGGNFSALNGNINVRSAAYNGSGNVNLDGGNYLSNNLNVYSGKGAITGSVGQVSGTLNTLADATHVLSDTATLHLGNNTAAGDPTYANSGDIVINGAVVAGEAVTILAGGNITASGDAYISTTPLLTGSAANITLVAGAKVTNSGTSTATIPGSSTGIATGTASADFAAADGATGGNIDLSGSTHNGAIIDASAPALGGNGGNVLLAANAVNGNGGFVNIGAGGTSGRSINTEAMLGNGGNVTIYAGANALTTASINLSGSVQTSGGGTFKSGDINIATVNPTASSGTTVTYDPNGGLHSGSATIVAGNSFAGNGKVATGDLITAAGGGIATVNGGTGGAITIQSGGAISTGNLSTFGGGGGGASLAVNLGIGGTGGAGGTVTLEGNGAGTSAASIAVTGDINSSGGGGGGSLGNAASGGGAAGAVSLAAAGPVAITGNIYAGDGGTGGIFGFSTSSGGGGGGSLGGAGGGAGAANLLGVGGAAGGGGAGLFGGGGGGVSLLGSLLGGGGGGGGGGIFGAGGAGVGSLLSGVTGLLGLGGSGAVTGLLNNVGGLGATILGQGGLGGLTSNSQGIAGLGVPGLTLGSVSTANANVSVVANSLSVGGVIFGRNVSLSAPVGSNGSIDLTNNVTGTSSISLTAHGTGDISNVGGQVYTPTLSLSTDNASIGSAANPFTTNATTLTAIAGGAASNAYLSDSSAVTLSGVNGAGANGVFSLTSAGNISAGTGESITAGSVALTSTGSAGNIGTTNTPIAVTAANLTANALGNVNVVDNATGPVNLGASSAGAASGSFTLDATNASSLNTTGTVTAHIVTLDSDTAGAAINVGSSVTATTDGVVTLNSAGAIGQANGSGLVTGATVNLNAASGDIGSSSDPLATAAQNLGAAASGNVYLANTGAVNVLASSAGSGDTYSLTTTPDANGNGAITVSGNIASTSGGPIGEILLNSSESGVGVGGIQEGALMQGTLTATTVQLGDGTSGAGNGNLGSAASPLLVDTSNLGANTTGAVYVDNSGTGNLNLGALTGSSINLQTGGGTTTTGNITTPGAFDLDTDAFTNANTLTAGSVHITGLTGQDLTIENSGQITATNGNIVLDSAPGKNLLVGDIPGDSTIGTWTVSGANQIILNANGDPTSTNGIIFTGSQNFNTDPTGSTVLNAAAGPNQFVEVQDGVTVVGNNTVTVNTANLDLDGSGQLIGNALNLVGGTVGTTISNTTGNVNLTGNITFHGQNLTILSEGNVSSKGNFTIDLSNSSAGSNNGNGGDLTIIAGYDFAPQSGSSGANAPVVISGPSVSGGSVNLSGISITTASTVMNGTGGNVLVIAHGAGDLGGAINLGTITTNAMAAGSTASHGGSVMLIGDGINVGNINSRGTVGGDATIESATPLLSAPITITHGAMSGGTFSADATTLGGNLVLNAVNTGNAVVTLATGGLSSVTGTSATQSITAAVLNVVSGDGGIGTAAAPIFTSASTLTAKSGLTGSVYVSDSSKTLVLDGSNWGSTYSLTNTDAATITVANGMSTNNFVINDKGGAIILPTSNWAALADPLTGNGGTIMLVANTITYAGQATSPLTLTASASGTGTQNSAGSITVLTNNSSTSTIGSGAGDIQFVVNSGSNGNGGTVKFANDGAAVLVDVANGLKVGVGANGNGANIAIEGQTVGQLGGGTLVLNSDGKGTGSGGSVSVSELANTDALIGSSANANFNLSARGVNGGSVSFATGGNLTVDMSGLQYNPTALNGNGGNVSLTGATLTGASVTGTAAGPFILTASANILGTGNGGSASIQLTKAGTAANVGTASGDYELVALGGKKVGNGGSASFINAGDLTVDPKGIVVAPTSINGNGGSITLEAGHNSTAGNLLVTKALSAAAKGKGVGGNISLTSNGGNLTIGGTKANTVNGVLGALSVKGKSNGNISLTNVNGSVDVNSALTAVNDALITAGGVGNIVLASSVGSATSTLVNLQSAGSVTAKSAGITVAAKTVQIAAGNVAGATIGSNKTALGVNTQNLTANAAGLVHLNDKSTLDTLINASSGSALNLTTAGNMIVNGILNGGSLLALKSGSGKAITSNSLADTLDATAVNLTGGRNGLGTSTQALQLATSALTVVSSGASNLNSLGTSALTLNSAKVSKSFALKSGGDMLLNGPIGSSTSTTTLTATGTGNILQGGMTTAIVSGKTVNLTANGGAIGLANSAVKVKAANLNLNSAALVNAANLSSAASTIGGVAGTAFDLTTAANTTLGNITASAGNIAVNESRGILQTAANDQLLATNGSITLQNSSTSGSIVLGGNSKVTTAGANGGNVSIFIGTAPLSGSATRPAGVTESITAGDSVNYGAKGVTMVKGGSATINAHGANVVLSTGSKAATAIKINSGVIITADPPVSTAAVINPGVATAPSTVSNSNNGNSNNSNSNNSNSLNNLNSLSNLSIDTAPKAAYSTSNGTALNGGISHDVAINSNYTNTLNATAGITSFDAAEHSNFDINQETAWISDTELANGEIPALMSSDDDMGISSKVSVIADMQINSTDVKSGKKVNLNRGSVVFAPQTDIKISTGFGDIDIAAHSLVLVLAYSNGIGVYDLDDRQKEAVKVTMGGNQLTLRPGVGAVITRNHGGALEQVNPAQLFGYRNIRQHEMGTEHRGYTCEFSMPQAIRTVQPLKQLVSSKHPQAQKMAARLLKTTSILMQLGGSSEFKQVLRPNTVACAAGINEQK